MDCQELKPNLWALNTSADVWEASALTSPWVTSSQTSGGAGGLSERNGARSMSLRHILVSVMSHKIRINDNGYECFHLDNVYYNLQYNTAAQEVVV